MAGVNIFRKENVRMSRGWCSLSVKSLVAQVVGEACSSAVSNFNLLLIPQYITGRLGKDPIAHLHGVKTSILLFCFLETLHCRKCGFSCLRHQLPEGDNAWWAQGRKNYPGTPKSETCEYRQHHITKSCKTSEA
jgi:hypothetical protein